MDPLLLFLLATLVLVLLALIVALLWWEIRAPPVTPMSRPREPPASRLDVRRGVKASGRAHRQRNP